MTKTQLYNSKIRKDAEKINLAFYYEHLKIQLALQDTQFRVPDYVLSLQEANALYEQYMYNLEDYHQAELMNHAIREKARKLRQWLIKAVEKSTDFYFVTLTFRDDVLKNTNQKTRKEYIQRFFLSSNCDYAYALDYGDESNREHYHAITSKKILSDEWPYGFIVSRKLFSDDAKKVLDVTIAFNKDKSERDTQIEHTIRCFAGSRIRYIANKSYKASLIDGKQHRIIKSKL